MTDMEKGKDNVFPLGTSVTLTDEETGEDVTLSLAARYDKEGQTYYAFRPGDDLGEYVILKCTVDGDDLLFETIDDDDEFEEIEDYFNDLLFTDVEYD
ncbi:MAG: DUF1292 domain-containing protein [Clostridia bacterium]|nr:DUF1292 domain-containing protein [Clostridia bacterium]